LGQGIGDKGHDFSKKITKKLKKIDTVLKKMYILFVCQMQAIIQLFYRDAREAQA